MKEQNQPTTCGDVTEEEERQSPFVGSGVTLTKDRNAVLL